MLKLLPDASQRLVRKLAGGPVEQRVKAIQLAQELGLLEEVGPLLLEMCADASARIRSKAVTALGELQQVPSETILDRVLHDTDARVRANAIEVLETKRREEYVPLLATRTRSGDGRERANAIKALHAMKVGTASSQLTAMLRDDRPAHRVSALWALRQMGVWQMLTEVGKLARSDPNLRVRRYAMAILRMLAESAAASQAVGAS
jgi:HEAT repeat protein